MADCASLASAASERHVGVVRCRLRGGGEGANRAVVVPAQEPLVALRGRATCGAFGAALLERRQPAIGFREAPGVVIAVDLVGPGRHVAGRRRIRRHAGVARLAELAETASTSAAPRRGAARAAVVPFISPAPRSSGGPRRGSARAPVPSWRRATLAARRAAPSIRRRRGCVRARAIWRLPPICRSCIESRSFDSRSAASRSAAAAPFDSSRFNMSAACFIRAAAPRSSLSAFSIPGILPSRFDASPAMSSVRLPIDPCRSACPRAASRSSGDITSEGRGMIFARSSAISCAIRRASLTASPALSRSASPARPVIAAGLRQLGEVLAGPVQAGRCPLRFALRLGEVPLGEQTADLLGALPRPIDLLAEAALRVPRLQRRPAVA